MVRSATRAQTHFLRIRENPRVARESSARTRHESSSVDYELGRFGYNFPRHLPAAARGLANKVFNLRTGEFSDVTDHQTTKFAPDSISRFEPGAALDAGLECILEPEATSATSGNDRRDSQL